MKKYLGFKKRSLFSLAAIALAFTMVSPLSIYAAEPVDQSEVALQSVGVTREEAIAMFGLTEEEAANATFYCVDYSSSIQSRGVVDINTPWRPPAFHFTGDNIGSYQTMNGTKLKYRILWKPDPGDGSQFCNVYLYPYGQNYVDRMLLTYAAPEYANDPSFREKISDWIDIIYGLDYHFVYESRTGHGGMYPTDYGCTIEVLVVVV